MYKFVCGIVTYSPNNTIISKIENYAKVFDKVIIYDNTPGGASFLKKTSLRSVDVISNGANDGLSHAYNVLIKSTVDNFNYLCLLDQDSIFKIKQIKNLMYVINKNINSKIALIGPYINFMEGVDKNTEKRLHRVDFLISSGTMINLNLIKKEKIMFDEKYFIDRVDLDFCTTCKKKKLNIFQYDGSVLLQRLGQGRSGEHISVRHYYMFRNRFYYNRKFKKHYLFLDIAQTIKQCYRIILFENSKGIKLKQLFIAYYDYKHGVMGKGRY